ncbi:hypothetical protein EYF80_010043 [Liparis tanakae]|uniref:Uncharacterized protein n=1 Tax=Liparis tanakae TaxID=230148 RepID=A0A4Z2INQ9_9TELE|nr:hypothetical protein EYF80_010043 [Liparis tanakae]
MDPHFIRRALQPPKRTSERRDSVLERLKIDPRRAPNAILKHGRTDTAHPQQSGARYTLTSAETVRGGSGPLSGTWNLMEDLQLRLHAKLATPGPETTPKEGRGDGERADRLRALE